MNRHSIFGRRVSVCFATSTLCSFSFITVMDPRISYMALREEFANDDDLAHHLEVSKERLQTYFKENYPSQAPTALSSVSSVSISSISSSSSPQKNYTARFQRKRTSPDELLEFWSLPQEDFEIIDPLQWWHSRRSQFPRLYHLARDIFSIPGMTFSLHFLEYIIILNHSAQDQL